MKKMKYLVTVGLLFLGMLILTACDTNDFSGTWNYPENNDEMGMYLIINGSEAKLTYEGVIYETGLLTVKEKEVAGTLFKGELKGSKLTVTSVEAPEDEVGISVSKFEDVTFELSLSDNKSQLILTDENGSEITFNK